MKKTISILGIAVLLAVGMTGCDFEWPWQEVAEDEGTDDEKPVDEEKPTDETPGVVPSGPLIDFNSEPKSIALEDIAIGSHSEVLNKYYYVDDLGALDEWQIADFYELGAFNFGDYEGQKLYLLVMSCDGPCFTAPNYRFTVNADGTWTAFSRYLSYVWDEWMTEAYGELFENYDNLLIGQLEYPKSITDKNTGTLFELVEDDPFYMLDDLDSSKIFESNEVGSVYVEKEGQCVVAELPDGTAQRYDMVVDFSTGVDNYESYEVESLGESAGEVFDITWSDGTKEDAMYSYKGIYGFGPCVYVKNDTYPMSKLKEIGKTGKGDPVYGFASSDAQALEDFYDIAFPEYMGDEIEKPTYEKFVEDNPLFYWVDPYGRLIEFGRAEYQPMAEIGKPVIYLYPEAEEIVHVEVEPTHGISISEPLYGRDGWTVSASPSGELLNLDDGEVYPYLFWEGFSLDYQMPSEGFVVAYRDVGEFLKEKLAVLGLVGGEIDDFMEFWAPKFNSAPYYYITFMPQDDFEKIAPLTVTPTPDSVIRVYMDYAPLRRPIDVVEPALVTPARDGFTVIEWGGALHKTR